MRGLAAKQTCQNMATCVPKKHQARQRVWRKAVCGREGIPTESLRPGTAETLLCKEGMRPELRASWHAFQHVQPVNAPTKAKDTCASPLGR